MARRSEAERIAAVEAARVRRVASANRSLVRWEQNVEPVMDRIRMTLRRRVEIASEYLRSRVMVNVSRPVTKTPVTRRRTVTRGGITRRAGSQYTLVTDRSKPGEFPKADTTQMMRNVFRRVETPSAGVWDGYVGTPQDYGAILELDAGLDRRWLTRTLDEERDVLIRILSGPLR